MPVRVKQRAIGSEKGEDEKQLQALKRQIVGLLLAWHTPVSVSLKSADSNRKLQIRDNKDLNTKIEASESSSRAFDLSLVRRTFSQAGFIEPSDWDDWIKTSARTPFITMKGAISLQPAPSKQVQFISLGIHPVSTDVANNVLYDEVNRLFASSSFGNQEISDTRQAAKVNKSKDRRFKQDGFTNKQLKGGGKGVDRWPMFCIRIELHEHAKQEIESNTERLREGTLSGVLKVLGAMTTSFLKENHFRPRARLERREQNAPRKPEARRSSSPRLQQLGGQLQSSKSSSDRYQDSNFGAWSRVKVGAAVIRPAACPYSSSLQGQSALINCDGKGVAEPCSEPTITPEPQKSAHTGCSDPPTGQDCEQTLEWKNPISGATILINARTGLVVNPQFPKRPATAPSESGLSTPPSLVRAYTTAAPNHARRLTRSISSPFVIPKAGSWSSDLLAKWENPVFDTTEEDIPQVSLDGPNIEISDILHGRRHCCSDLDIQKAFTQSSSAFSARLSKSALKDAKIISQVDKKFILIGMSDRSQTNVPKGGKLLVLVDQHAADERVRVEGLLRDLSSIPTSLAKHIIFETQAREQEILARQAAYFADWGILYDVVVPPGTHKCRVSVRALPTAIAERCRIEPKVLIELLRAEAWKREENGGLSSTKQCPKGLLDMLNSRACRSAIMFNDELTHEEAQTLIQRLGDCAFPFQCAHGRPSMIPLVDLGSSSSFGMGGKAFGVPKGGEAKEEKGFGEAWKMWKPSV